MASSPSFRNGRDKAPPVSLPSIETAERSLLRHIQQGRNLRTPNASNCARNLATAAMGAPEIGRLCREHRVTCGELAAAYLEILAAMSAPILPGPPPLLAPTRMLADPDQLALFLRDLQRDTLGLTPLQRRLAMVERAKKQAKILEDEIPRPPREITRSFLLKSSIQSKLPLLALIVAIIVAAIALAAYLL